MFLWDYILTFQMEVDLVWKSKWNFMKALYLFQRYLPFFQIIWLVFIRQSDVVSYLIPMLKPFQKKIIFKWERRLCVGGNSTLTQVRKIGPPYFEMQQVELI